MSTVFRGVILLAAARDADNHAVLLCFAVVGQENRDNWRWFFSLMYADFQNICVIMADKHGGLSSVWSCDNLPRFLRCVKHMLSNMRNDVKTGTTGGSDIQELVYALARAPSERYYQFLLRSLRFALYF